MITDTFITILLLAGIILLVCGITRNEKVKARRFHRTPGGKYILSALVVIIVVFVVMLIRVSSI